jgi:hypothetical protein
LKIDFDKNKLTKAKLSKQIASYIATKEIVRERGLGFLVVKCHPSLVVLLHLMSYSGIC